MATRRITAGVRDRIRELVDVLYPFLPLTARSTNTTTFKTIFAESNLDLEGEVKRRALQAGWESVIRYHPRLPHSLIRKIVPAAIAYRRYKRAPLRQEEINRLIECLDALGIQMGPELRAIEIDESVPEIQIPPKELYERLQSHPLAPEIAGEPAELFRNGHFNESVRKAAERFEVRVQELSGLTDIGKDLMAKALRLDNPRVRLNSLSTDNERGIQEGYQFLTMGMIRAIRNIFSHGDEEQRAPEEAYEMLLFLNWLFRQLPRKQ